MNKEFLPQGDGVRQLLVKSNITEGSINSFLKNKGVFLGRYEKNDSIPFLMKSLISPQDFENLYEIQKGKEESVKHRTASISCKSDFSFPDVLGKVTNINNYINEKHTYRPGYKVIGSPGFYYEGDDTAILKYRIERENLRLFAIFSGFSNQVLRV